MRLRRGSFERDPSNGLNNLFDKNQYSNEVTGRMDMPGKYLEVSISRMKFIQYCLVLNRHFGSYSVK